MPEAHTAQRAPVSWVLEGESLTSFQIHLFERQTDRRSSHLLVHSPRCPQKQGLDQVKVGSQEPRLGLPRGQQGPNCLSRHLPPPRVHISGELGSGCRVGRWPMCCSLSWAELKTGRAGLWRAARGPGAWTRAAGSQGAAAVGHAPARTVTRRLSQGGAEAWLPESFTALEEELGHLAGPAALTDTCQLHRGPVRSAGFRAF